MAFQGQMNQTELQARQQNVQNIQDENLRAQELQKIHDAEIVAIALKGAQDRNNIEIQFSDAKGFNAEYRRQLELQQIDAQNAAVAASEEKHRKESMDGFERWADTNKATMQKVSDAAKISLVSGMGSAFTALGGALARGENGLAAFGKAFIGILGDIAIQTGNMFIALAFANSAIPVFGLSGFAAFAAGAALS